MKVWPILLLLGVLTSFACDDSSGPSGATITFRVDEITCSGGANVELTIDGASQGSYQIAPGAERTFSVSTGVHNVRAQGEEPQGAFVNLEREVTVPEGGNFIVVLTCTD